MMMYSLQLQIDFIIDNMENNMEKNMDVDICDMIRCADVKLLQKLLQQYYCKSQNNTRS